MGLAMALGRCWQAMLRRLDGFTPLPPSRVVLAAAREFDPGEREALEAAGVRLVPADAAGLDAALTELAGRTDEVHLHLDMDAHDAAFGRANAWARPGGLDGDGYLAAVRLAVERCRVASVSLASYDPGTDANGAIAASALRLLAAARGPAGAGPLPSA